MRRPTKASAFLTLTPPHMVCIIKTPTSPNPLAILNVANELQAWEEMSNYLADYPLAWFDLLDESEDEPIDGDGNDTATHTRNIGWVKEGYEYLDHWT